MIKRDNPLIYVCGISGVGKTSIVHGSSLSEIVSYTSRPKREGEEQGIDYHFYSKQWMEQMHHILFEHDFKYFNDNYYATATEDIQSSDCQILRLQDAIEYFSNGINCVIVCVIGPVRATREGRDQKKERLEWDKLYRDFFDRNQHLIGKQIFTIHNMELNASIERLEEIKRKVNN